MEMKLYVSKQQPRNFKHLTSFLNKEWAVIPPELCVNLVTTYRKDSVRLNEGPPPNFFSKRSERQIISSTASNPPHFAMLVSFDYEATSSCFKCKSTYFI